MRARLEPTQLECLSDASFLGKLLVLPANVRLDWKVVARYKHSSLFGLIISNKGKKKISNKLECLHLAKTVQSGLTFAGSTRSLPKKEASESSSNWVCSGLALKF